MKIIAAVRAWFRAAWWGAAKRAVRAVGAEFGAMYVPALPTTTSDAGATYILYWHSCHEPTCRATGAWDVSAYEYWCAAHGWHPEYLRWVRAWTRRNPAMRKALLTPPDEPFTYTVEFQ